MEVSARKERLRLLDVAGIPHVQGQTDGLQNGLPELVLVILQPLNDLDIRSIPPSSQLVHTLRPNVIDLFQLLYRLSGQEGGKNRSHDTDHTH